MILFTQYIVVLRKNGQWRTEMCWIQTSGRGWTTVKHVVLKDCLMALGIVSSSTSLPCLCFHDSINSEVEREYQGWNKGDISIGSAFSKEESARWSSLHTWLLLSSSVWVRIGVLIWNVRQETIVRMKTGHLYISFSCCWDRYTALQWACASEDVAYLGKGL